MHAKELRIGNLVEIDNHKYHPKMKGISLAIIGIVTNEYEESIYLEIPNKQPNTYYEVYAQFIKFIKPIPITEEWLLKFGLPYTTEKDYYYLTFTIKGLLFETSGIIEGFSYNLCFDDIINIQYVHQLQNLFFALTGEELVLSDAVS